MFIVMFYVKRTYCYIGSIKICVKYKDLYSKIFNTTEMLYMPELEDYHQSCVHLIGL